MKKKLLSLLTSFMLSFSLLGSIPISNAVSAASADEQVVVSQSSEDEIVGKIISQSDLGTVEMIDDSLVKDVPTFNSDTSDINAVSNSFVTSTGTKYGYNFLAKVSKGAKRQQFYNDVYQMCVKFWNQTIDHSTQTYKSSAGNTFYIIQMLDHKKYGLTIEEAVATYSVVKHDNPSFYFLPTTIAWNFSGSLAPLVPMEYASKSTRKTLQDSIISYTKKMSGMVKSNYTNYYKALTFNNYIRDNYDYALTNGSASQENYAHNIIGPIKYKKGVCEAFAKVYQLILNYIKLDNIYVIGKGNGGGHAWNMVKFDNGKYYYVDTTWNQNTHSNKFFAKGTKAFVETSPTHVAYTKDTKYLDFLYDLPTVPSGDYNGTREKYKVSKGDFTKTLANFTKAEVSYASAKFTWDAPSVASGIYVLQYNNSKKAYVQVAKLDKNATKYTFENLKPGTTYKFAFKTYYVYNGKTLTSDKPNTVTVKTLTVPKSAPSITRYAGNDRFATAVSISKALTKKSSYVVIASGMDYHDALAGVPLAHALNAPILLSSAKGLDTKTISEIKRRGAKKAIILSTSGAVPTTVETQLSKAGIAKKNVERIKGSTCYETSAKIAKRLQKATGKQPTSAFFVYSDGFADALSISNVAALKGAPIFYINAKGSVDKNISSYLKSLKYSIYTYILGGPKLISSNAETNIKKNNVYSVSRIYGADRYETCRWVNFVFSSTLKGTQPCLVTGLNFPDALAGGVLAASTKSPIILVANKVTEEQQKTLTDYKKRNGIKKICVLGGTGVVTPTVAYQAAAAAA